jgi:hypothetical protein
MRSHVTQFVLRSTQTSFALGWFVSVKSRTVTENGKLLVPGATGATASRRAIVAAPGGSGTSQLNGVRPAQPHNISSTVPRSRLNAIIDQIGGMFFTAW